MQPISITTGINTVMDFCNEFRSKETAGYYAGACEFILTVYQQLNQETYDADLNAQIRGDIQKELFSSGYNSYRYIFRVLGMLDDYYSGHPFRNKYMLNNRYKHQLNPMYQQWADELKSSLTVKNTTIPTMYSIIRDFFYYLQQNGITELDCVHHEFLYTFLMHEYTDHHASMGNVMYVLRHICIYLRKNGMNNFPTELLPFSLPPSRRKVLPAFERTDMESILSMPDTKTPSGKRDYAILMLASVTGIRAIDIANLKLIDINWKEMTVYFIQHKTGFGVSLPMESVAAEAVADYILNGRPDVAIPYVFLTEAPPFRKLNDKSSVANVLNKYVKLANIEKRPRDGKTFHAFRRNMGIWLLNSGAEPELISQVLGHKSKDVLKRYLPLNASKLEICALDFDGIPVKSEVYR